MRAVVVGRVVDELGLCRSIGLEQRGALPELTYTYARLSALEYRTAQPEEIFLDVEHERAVGRVKYLERQRGVGLFAVAEVVDITELPTAKKMFFSAETTSDRVGPLEGHDIVLNGLAVVERPGTNAQTPVRIIPGSLAEVARWKPHLLLGDCGLIQRAADHRGGTTEIVQYRDAAELAGIEAEELTRQAQRGRGNERDYTGPTSRRMVIDGKIEEVRFTKPYAGVLSVR